MTTGLYARVRHPVYTALLLAYAGTALLLPSAFTLFSFLGALAGTYAQARSEEAFLVERFGDAYGGYLRRTGRFLPRLRGR